MFIKIVITVGIIIVIFLMGFCVSKIVYESISIWQKKNFHKSNKPCEDNQLLKEITSIQSEHIKGIKYLAKNIGLATSLEEKDVAVEMLKEIKTRYIETNLDIQKKIEKLETMRKT